MTAAEDLYNSRPTLCGFDPSVIPYQREVIDLIRSDWDYAQGTLEILLSGAYGSAKSTLLAHLAVTHALENPRAVVGIGRRARQDLKDTIWREILEHIEEDLTEGVDYVVNLSELRITFSNGSQIKGLFWGDGKYKKFRSLKFSMVIIEEIVENDDDDEEAFKQIKARLRRLPHVRENVLLAATNPDAPTHWVHRYFIAPNEGAQHPTRYVFYSRAADNPFLDAVYTSQLRADMSPREAERYLDGKWNELYAEVVYYEYRTAVQYVGRPGATELGRAGGGVWTPRPELGPIGLSFDFNIGHGKPMSAIQFQYDIAADTFHFFNEVVIEGARTQDVVEEWHERGQLSPQVVYTICGDCNGKNKDTRNNRSDYDIITQTLSRLGYRFEMNVPLHNPQLRARHLRTNAYCKSADGKVRLYLWQNAKKADEGMRLVKLKKGADYQEDDSKDWQHVTTAMGYALMATLARSARRAQGMVQL